VSARLPIEDVGELYDVEFDDDLDVDTWAVVALELAGFRCPAPKWFHTVCDYTLKRQDHRDGTVGTVLLSPAETNGEAGRNDASANVSDSIGSCVRRSPEHRQVDADQRTGRTKVAITRSDADHSAHHSGIIHRNDFR